MGPRPTRPRPQSPPGAPRPAPVVVTTPRQVAAVGAPSPRRGGIAETVPLPAETRTALSAIVKTMRDVPRALIGDPAEVVHFLGRTVRALERLRDQPVSVASASPKLAAATPAPSLARPQATTARQAAEAVFRTPSTRPQVTAETLHSESAGAVPRPRIIMDRKGRGVRVEVRRAREAGQIEMFG